MTPTRSLLKAIVAKIAADSGVAGLSTAVGGRVYLSRMVDRMAGASTAKFPYLVVEIVTDDPVGELGSKAAGETIERFRVQFSAFDASDGNSPDTCATVKDKIVTLFDRSTMDMSGDGYGTARCVREPGGTGPRRVEQEWMATVDYIFVFV